MKVIEVIGFNDLTVVGNGVDYKLLYSIIKVRLKTAEILIIITVEVKFV